VVTALLNPLFRLIGGLFRLRNEVVEPLGPRALSRSKQGPSIDEAKTNERRTKDAPQWHTCFVCQRTGSV
jgi:hypothetical protein